MTENIKKAYVDGMVERLQELGYEPTQELVDQVMEKAGQSLDWSNAPQDVAWHPPITPRSIYSRVDAGAVASNMQRGEINRLNRAVAAGLGQNKLLGQPHATVDYLPRDASPGAPPVKVPDRVEQARRTGRFGPSWLATTPENRLREDALRSYDDVRRLSSPPYAELMLQARGFGSQIPWIRDLISRGIIQARTGRPSNVGNIG